MRKKVAIVGSRKYPYPDAVRGLVKALERDIQIVSGGASGVDTIAVEMAKELNMPWKVFPAKWRRADGSYDKGAGHKRNSQIVSYCDALYAFWTMTPDSPGTLDSIRKALRANKLAYVMTPFGVLSPYKISAKSPLNLGAVMQGYFTPPGQSSSSEFMAAAELASQEVANWPEWKKTGLRLSSKSTPDY